MSGDMSGDCLSRQFSLLVVYGPDTSRSGHLSCLIAGPLPRSIPGVNSSHYAFAMDNAGGERIRILPGQEDPAFRGGWYYS